MLSFTLVAQRPPKSAPEAVQASKNADGPEASRRFVKKGDNKLPELCRPGAEILNDINQLNQRTNSFIRKQAEVPDMKTVRGDSRLNRE